MKYITQPEYAAHRIMNQNNIVNFGKLNLIQINFNFFRIPEGPKRKLPVKTVLSAILGLLALLSGGTQRQLTQGMTVKIVSPAPNSIFTVGSTVPLVARATTKGTITSVKFHATTDVK